MQDRLRVSFIEYLNALPLGWGFLHGSLRDRVELVFDVPSECARHLKAGQVDVGLIPVVEYLRIPDLLVIPDLAIASRNRVRSVLFVSRKPIEEVENVAVDSSSRTSSVLLQILLTKFYERNEVAFRPEPPDPSKMLQKNDSALIIGNAALQLDLDGLYVYDLALEWNRFTGLPFVFAFWAVRADVEMSENLEYFFISRDEGLSAIDEIARLYAPRLGLTSDEIRSYLRSNLDFSLDGQNLEGLRTFFELSVELGLAPDVHPLRFCK